jgi:hypothetical protein
MRDWAMQDSAERSREGGGEQWYSKFIEVSNPLLIKDLKLLPLFHNSCRDFIINLNYNHKKIMKQRVPISGWLRIRRSQQSHPACTDAAQFAKKREGGNVECISPLSCTIDWHACLHIFGNWRGPTCPRYTPMLNRRCTKHWRYVVQSSSTSVWCIIAHEISGPWRDHEYRMGPSHHQPCRGCDSYWHATDLTSTS